MKKHVLALGLALLVAGCAPRNATIVPAGSAPSPSTVTQAETTVSITIPAAPQTSSAARRAAYISTASNSMVLTPQGQTPIVLPLSTTTPGCRTLNGARICTFRISLPTGSYIMRIALYAATDGTGVPLALVSTTTTIVPNATNNLDFTLGAVVSAVSISLLPNNIFTSGTAATRTINVAAFDSAGATIVVGRDALVDAGGAPVTIQLSDTDTTGVTAISPTIAGAIPSVLSYNGGQPTGTYVLAAAKTASNATLATAKTSFVVAAGSGCGAAAPVASERHLVANAPICTLVPPPRFLSWPLKCRVAFTLPDGPCPGKTQYTYGAYTDHIMFSVLDHHMQKNVDGNYPYLSGDQWVVAFNGEFKKGTVSSADATCVTGELHLPTTAGDSSTDLIIQGCGAAGVGFASYDEHPGYDYDAYLGTPVFAAAPGSVVDNGDKSSQKAAMCVRTPYGSCEAYGFVGIDHGNGYISQYGHLSQVYVTPGEPIDQAWIDQHKPIGLSGNTSPKHVGYHLHFEVLAHVPGKPYDYNDLLNWAIVDPYGWTGGINNPLYPTGDPIYSYQMYLIQPGQLWK
jgi:hypothetical protein